MIKKLLIAILPGMLCACSFLSPVNVEPATQYLIKTPPKHLPRVHQKSGVMFVATPYVQPVFNTVKMAYQPANFEISYFNKHVWAESPSLMLQNLLMSTLDEMHVFRAVVAPPYLGDYAYILDTHVETFMYDFSKPVHTFKLKIKMSYSTAFHTRLIKQKTFDITVPLISDSPDNVILAANQATEQMLMEFAKFMR